MSNAIHSNHLKNITLADGNAQISKKSIAVRLGNSVLWLDSDWNPDASLLPKKEGIKRRQRGFTRGDHDKQQRIRCQNKKPYYEHEPS